MTYQSIVADVPKYQGVLASRFFFILASGLSACVGRVLAALHESRRDQAARELTKYRSLIQDPGTS
jgi:hypothetical protein